MNTNIHKYPFNVVDQLSKLIAMKDQASKDYMSGPKMVNLFKSLGFQDVYVFPGKGIVSRPELA